LRQHLASQVDAARHIGPTCPYGHRSGPSITISTPNSIFVGSVTTFETDVIFGIYCLSDPNGGMWWNLLVTHP
jgi:hypothetical protein